MYDIAEQVTAWLATGLDPTVAAVVATRGFSSRSPGAAAAWVDGAEPVGTLLEGVSPTVVAGHGLVDVTISDADATAAGLSCGGTATLLVQPASAFGRSLWPALIAREPLCVVWAGDGVQVFDPQTIRSAREFGDAVPRLFGRGVSATLLTDETPRVAAVAVWPVPTLVVAGDGLIADALCAAAALLGWSASAVASADSGVAAVSSMHRCDAVVVLSHDRAVDGPVLAAALGGGAGYVGALGSRHTQAARADWLTAHGVDVGAQARIHGPAGLDIDAHTPAEIAVSIVAEVLASRSGSSGGALRDRPGPVHVAGVQAPPPRY